jgi:hypothetical protein
MRQFLIRSPDLDSFNYSGKESALADSHILSRGFEPAAMIACGDGGVAERFAPQIDCLIKS